MPDRRNRAWWVLCQVGLHSLMFVHQPQVILNQTKPSDRLQQQHFLPLVCPMDHVLLERAAHDDQTVLGAPDWEDEAVGKVEGQFPPVRLLPAMLGMSPFNGFVALQTLQVLVPCR
jgi:hypothetical protein